LDSTVSPRRPWLKLAALVLVIAALGLPINDLLRYAVLVIAAVVVVVGAVTPRASRWLAAAAAVGLCIAGQILFKAPRIEEGHNVFIVDGEQGAALVAGCRPRCSPSCARSSMRGIRRGGAATPRSKAAGVGRDSRRVRSHSPWMPSTTMRPIPGG
jgi:hypothetical protein